jgi:hypothetical protein
MTKRLIGADDQARDAARSQLVAPRIKDTANTALRAAAGQLRAGLGNALSVLTEVDLDDRAAAWR